MRATFFALLGLACTTPAFAADIYRCDIAAIDSWGMTPPTHSAVEGLSFVLDGSTGAVQVSQGTMQMGAPYVLVLRTVGKGAPQLLGNDDAGKFSLRIDLTTLAAIQVNDNNTVLTGSCTIKGKTP